MEKLCLNEKEEYPDDEILSRYPGKVIKYEQFQH